MQVGDQRDIGTIQNYYGALTLRLTASGYEWAIGDIGGLDWQPIPEYLAQALLRFDNEEPDRS